MSENRVAQVMFAVLGMTFAALALPELVKQIANLCWGYWDWEGWGRWDWSTGKPVPLLPVLILLLGAIVLLGGRRWLADRLFPAEPNSKNRPG